MARQFLNTRIEISKIFCSPARRTRETLVCARQTIKIDEAAIYYPSELYSGDVAAYHQLLKQLDPNKVCMIIGHNPMIENFAFDIAQTGDETGLAKIKLGFPTAAIAVIALSATFEAANPEGKLHHFLSTN